MVKRSLLVSQLRSKDCPKSTISLKYPAEHLNRSKEAACACMGLLGRSSLSVSFAIAPAAWDNQTSAQAVIYHHIIIPHMAFWLPVGQGPVLLLQRFPSWCDFMPRVSQVLFPARHVWTNLSLVSLQSVGYASLHRSAPCSTGRLCVALIAQSAGVGASPPRNNQALYVLYRSLPLPVLCSYEQLHKANVSTPNLGTH